jgi:hypothetical protein
MELLIGMQDAVCRASHREKNLVIIELEYWFRSNLMEIGLRKWFSVETIFRLYVSR